MIGVSSERRFRIDTEQFSTIHCFNCSLVGDVSALAFAKDWNLPGAAKDQAHKGHRKETGLSQKSPRPTLIKEIVRKNQGVCMRNMIYRDDHTALFRDVLKASPIPLRDSKEDRANYQCREAIVRTHFDAYSHS